MDPQNTSVVLVGPLPPQVMIDGATAVFSSVEKKPGKAGISPEWRLEGAPAARLVAVESRGSAVSFRCDLPDDPAVQSAIVGILEPGSNETLREQAGLIYGAEVRMEEDHLALSLSTESGAGVLALVGLEKLLQSLTEIPDLRAGSASWMAQQQPGRMSPFTLLHQETDSPVTTLLIDDPAVLTQGLRQCQSSGIAVVAGPLAAEEATLALLGRSLPTLDSSAMRSLLRQLLDSEKK